MCLYDIIIKPFVRNLDISRASRIALKYFRLADRIPGGRFLSRLIHNNRPSGLQKEIFGIYFYNPVGLGAGLDLHGELYNGLNGLGFSFVEIGPLDAKGIRKAVRNIQNDPPKDVIAACIHKDFLTSFTLAYDFCNFFVIDISSEFSIDVVEPLLFARIPEQIYKPIVVKIPDTISSSELDDIVDYCMLNSVDGIETSSINQIKRIHDHSEGRLPIIANCHIGSPEEASKSLEAGASLIELRSGLVREGPSFVSKILKNIQSQAKSKNEKPGTR